ncbi:hypothetical protein ACQPUY_07680 [Clostridium nigeriense]|uniref:hypothetical protein n=1 Tax=Clostridium nigeriense TaxID=1805470 RepID=UPI003D33D497
MRKLFNKPKKYKFIILESFICFILLYIINFYMNHSPLKLTLWILVIVAEYLLIQYHKN